MDKSYVVIGEASESDSEEEIDSSEHNQTILKNMSKSTQGIILSGEASESEDESKKSIPRSQSVNEINEIIIKELKKSNFSKKYQTPNYDSLLHKKLRERNISLNKNLNEFVNTIFNSALKDMTTTNKQLTKSHYHLQEASATLTSLHSNLNNIKSNLTLIANDTFLSNIKLKEKN